MCIRDSNCTDSTAAIAREHGAVVYERFNHVNVGKGYALDFLLQHIGADYRDFSCIKRLRNEGDKARKQTEELMKYPNL